MTATCTLLLLPGLDGTEILFAPLVRALPDWITPVVLNYPTAGPTAYDDLLPSVGQAIKAASSCYVLGWSFAGPLALKAAASRPDAVRGLILCASFIRAPRPELVAWRWAARAPVIATLRALRRLRYRLRGYPSDELRQAKAATWRRVNAAALAARARAVLAVDVRAELKACSVPLLYLASADDEVVPPSNLEEILALAPACGVTVLEGPHLALFTSAEKAATRIATFIRQCELARIPSGQAISP